MINSRAIGDLSRGGLIDFAIMLDVPDVPPGRGGGGGVGRHGEGIDGGEGRWRRAGIMFFCSLIFG